jgi:hypothetical protein
MNLISYLKLLEKTIPNILGLSLLEKPELGAFLF